MSLGEMWKDLDCVCEWLSRLKHGTQKQIV